MITKNTREFANNIKNSEIKDIDFVSDDDAIIYLNEIIKSKNITKANLLKLINHDANNGYKYLDGSRRMNRDFLLKIVIGLHLDIDTANRLLKLFSHSELYVKIKRDYVIISGLTSDKNLIEINNDLNNFDSCDLLI